MKVPALPTPCALVEFGVLERNAARMSARARALGVALRPHVKTHKCVEIARLQVRGHEGGVTVSTLAEARAFLAAGFGRITWAFPIPLDRIGEAAELATRAEALDLLVDDALAVDALAAEATRRGIELSVLLEFDCGDGRSGVDPRSPSATALAARIDAAPGLRFAGVLTHAGQSYACREAAGIAEVAEVERSSAAEFAELLRSHGIAVPRVSVGSTPTVHHAHDLRGVDEVRPGNYAFHDAFQVAIGSCALEDVAFSVLARVVSHQRERGRAVVNAGSLALSKDAGATHVDPACGYGLVWELGEGLERAPARLVGLSQEHGQLAVAPADAEDGRFAVGSLVRIVPNHSCLAAACFDRYHLVQGEDVVDAWRPVRGW